MDVRLKIRGKLVASFGAVMVMVLSGLGYITYTTFAEAIHTNKEQIAKLHLENIRLRVEALVNASRYEAARWEVQDKALNAPRLDALIRQSRQIEGAVILDASQNPLARAGRTEHLVREEWTALLEQSRGSRMAGDAILLAVPPLSPDGTSSKRRLLVQLSSRTLLERLTATSLYEEAVVLLARGKTPLLHSPLPESTQLDTLLEDLGPDLEVEQLAEVGDYFGLEGRLPQLDASLWYLIPRERYQQSLIELKNRVIAATLVILWVSIWVVLIIAHRISKPIRSLSRATNEMQASEYDEPLEFKNTGDEISDLALRFEKMRLHIRALISRDPLSNLYNRRYLIHALEKEVAKSCRKEVPLSCLMVDLDHFKQVNDTYGHQCGDEVIRRTAAAIQDVIRNYDICARYGGEEFIVILPMTAANDALIVAERIRARTQATPLEWDGQIVAPTLSIGAATMIGGPECAQENPGQSLIKAADEALYEAKSSGRNRVVVASGSPATGQGSLSRTETEPAATQGTPDAAEEAVEPKY